MGLLTEGGAAFAGGSLLGKLVGADFNITTDQAIPIVAGTAKYAITKIVVTNASISLTTAAGGLYTAASKGGTAVVAAVQIYSALTANTLILNPTLAVTNWWLLASVPTIFFNLTTAQGAAATADIYIFGDIL